MVHFTITAPIDLQQACSEIWIRPDARSGACDILPAEIKAWLTIIVIQKGLLDSRTSNASQIYSTHRNLAWSVVHSSTIRRSPNLSSTAKNRLLYPSPGTTGTSPYYNKKLASQKLPCSKHGIEKKYAITVTYLIFSLAESSRFDPYMVFLVLYTEFHLSNIVILASVYSKGFRNAWCLTYLVRIAKLASKLDRDSWLVWYETRKK